jgi:hypothetical protein
MARIAPYTFFQELDNNGEPLAGGLLYTYEAGTSTPKATYTDSTEATENANPVVLDASGRANVWLGTGAYKFILRTSAGVQIGDTVDNIVGEASNVFGASVTSVSTNTSVTETYKNGVIVCTSALTLSLIDADTAEEGFLFTVKNISNGNVTIDPDASELIDGAATLTLYPQQSAIIICNGTAWISVLLSDVRKNNYTATTAPTVNDDVDSGYAVGSFWYDITGDESYICLDATDGAAVWLNTTLTIDDLGSAAIRDMIDDDTFATATATNIPSAESVKAYVDTEIAGISITLGTAQASTSGSSIDFTSIPAGTKKIIINFVGVSTNGTAPIYVQLGDSGGLETTGYTAAAVSVAASAGFSSYSTGFGIRSASASNLFHGQMILSLENSSSFTWTSSHNLIVSGLAVFTGSGSKSLSAELDRVSVVTADTFDAGEINISYEG